jgi:(3R)-3-hydroxyacyl-CoA dehydrogenase / 3a,7a,12a-trihydroxy-5b-cholest-24-enoyl-CoA hydratase / enoyl-CoA hydratase 2
MSNELRYDGKVAIVTGAGNGLGRAHALLLASRGAKVVVNDLGGAATGGGKSSAAADKVVQEIKAAGGDAVANYDSVEDGAKIVQTALDTFKRIDIVINNAGILRDTTFHKMSQDDWDLIYRVHVLGAFRVTQAAWNHLRDQGYGRIIFTASAAGIYGNFGQANYSMAKLGLVGFANTLALEGAKKNVFANVIAPLAGSRLTETVMPKELTDQLKPELVSPLVAYLCHDSCTENGGLFEVGGGFMAKLRWQRTLGKSFKLGKPLTPDQVKAGWSDVTNWKDANNPSNVNEALAPAIENLSTKSLGGNEFIDVDQALGHENKGMTSSYTERDLAIYALGIGAGAAAPTDPNELRVTYEMSQDGFAAIPTYAAVPAVSCLIQRFTEGKQDPGMNYGPERILHGEQYTEVYGPIPVKANLKHDDKIVAIHDKGKHAVVVREVKTYNADTGAELFKNEITFVVKGAGGWGGDRGPSTEANAAPDRAPDAVVTEKTSASQALLYRLSGDINPLHADPMFAQAFGFDKPILHGLCTYGFAARHVISKFAGGDPRLLKNIRVRFAGEVFPGETLKTEMWKDGQKVLFRTTVVERNKVVITNAVSEIWKEVPKPVAAPVVAAVQGERAQRVESLPQSAAPAATGISTGDVFGAIGKYIAQNPETVKKVGFVYLFKVSNPDSQWTVDLKNGAGSVAQGAVGKADTTLEIANSDWMDMVTGKADSQKLYFGGKLKISGNVLASQKLEFLKKLDKNLLSSPSGGAVQGEQAKRVESLPTGSDSEGTSTVFGYIGGFIAENPDLAAKIQTVYLFKLTGPDSQWTLDLKNGTGSVSQGAQGKADCTLEISDADWVAMATGKADSQKLYFGGKLKITGNVLASQKLEFLKKIDRSKVKPITFGAASAAATTSAQAYAPAVFKALGERIAKTPGLVAEVGGVLQFKVKDTGNVWTVNLKDGKGAVEANDTAKADAVFTIADEDLGELAKTGAVKDLYMHGKLRVDGDARFATKLSFFKALV